MHEQFFGKTTLGTYIALFATTMFGILVWRFPVLSVPLLVGIMVFGCVLFLKNPAWAFAAVFAELFSFSHGRLIAVSFDGIQVTSRMALFVGVMIGWAIRVIQRKQKIQTFDVAHLPLILLGAAILWGLFVGWMRNDIGDVIEDANGYFFLGYLFPILTHVWNRQEKHLMLQSLFGSLLWIATLTLGSLYVFTHLPNEALVAAYKFLRDARIGEITQMDGGFWRIFFPSQIGLLFGLLFLFWFRAEEFSVSFRRWFVPMTAFMTAALLTSLSRSFAMGALVAFVVCGVIWFIHRRLLDKKIIVETLASVAISVSLLAVIALLPFPYASRVTDVMSPFSSRTSDLSDAAISSRWNLLPVMWEEIARAPIVGSGFGRVLAFVSDDPRVREIYPDGKWRTFSFEWGWLDLWIKMGILGVLAFLAIGLVLLRALWKDTEHPFWLRMGCLTMLVALGVTHVFSPYLNHPIGLGILLFITIFLPTSRSPIQAFNKKVSVPLPIISPEGGMSIITQERFQ